MKMYRKLIAVLALSGMCLAATADGGVEPARKHKRHPAEAQQPKCEACEQIQQLEEQIKAQQAQIEELKKSLNMPTADEQAREAAAAANQKAGEASAAAAQAQANANTANTTAGQAQQTANAANAQAEEVKNRVGELANEVEHPVALRYKGITLTPVGFLAGESFWRQRAENDDILSSFSGIPYSNNSLAHMSEFRETARQSKIGLLAQGKVGDVALTGYYEMDFLGAAPTANEINTSSFTPRQRQLFAEASWHGWTFTGGQTWTLLTTNTSGIHTRSEWIPMTIDADFLPGYTWGRLATFRVTKSMNEGKETAAFSLENPAAVYSPGVTVGNAGAVATGSATVPVVVVGGPGTVTLFNGNIYSTNLAPDLIGKLAFDPSFGHFEIKAVGRFLRDRVPGVGNNMNLAGGVGAALIVPVAHKKANIIAEGMVGRGIGRYGDSLEIDATFRPNGEIAPIKNLRGLGGIEVHVTPKLDWFVYGGDEYLGRTFYQAAGVPLSTGYGNPLLPLIPTGTNGNFECFLPDTPNAPCGAAIRNLVHGTTGFWYTMYKGGYGMLRMGTQYSWTYKTTWQDSNGFAPRASDSMAFTSLRYYLP